jgi:glycine/D-amino acid oxidase-like deaminating enzyme
MKILLIGQGISGTWLSYWLMQMGAEVMVLDDPRPNTSTRVASGVINPVTGRSVVTTWLAEELLPFSEVQYAQMGDVIGENVISNCGILAFPPSEQMRDAYLHRVSEGSHFIHPVLDIEQWASYFRFSFGGHQILPAYWIDLQTLLTGWRKRLVQNISLKEDWFNETLLQVQEDGITFKEHTADFVFYCDGIQTEQSKYWSGLPFTFNKGEALIADIPGLPQGQIYKFAHITLVPWQNGQWWVGSNYDNNYADELPTELFRRRTKQFLEHTLKLPFEITGHLAGIRPANLERRPFAGLHPHAPRVGILGGMGTKGVSVAPWLAKQVAEHILEGKPIEPTAEVKRFRRAFT